MEKQFRNAQGYLSELGNQWAVVIVYCIGIGVSDELCKTFFLVFKIGVSIS